jgi:hypothetical protein
MIMNEEYIEEYMKWFAVLWAKFHGHKLIFYEDPKDNVIGEYDGLQIIRSSQFTNNSEKGVKE